MVTSARAEVRMPDMPEEEREMRRSPPLPLEREGVRSAIVEWGLSCVENVCVCVCVDAEASVGACFNSEPL